MTTLTSLATAFLLATASLLCGLPACSEYSCRALELELATSPAYRFGLQTRAQSYSVTKQEGRFLLHASAGRFLTPASLPAEEQHWQSVSFTRGLNRPAECARLEALMQAVVDEGLYLPRGMDEDWHSEGPTPRMDLWHPAAPKDQPLSWNSCLGRLPDDRIERHYAALNEYLYGLFPELADYPTDFLYSTTPPAHRAGEWRAQRLAWHVADSPQERRQDEARQRAGERYDPASGKIHSALRSK